MITKFVYDPLMESQRLLNVYWSIAHGIYEDYGFFVLPYRVPGNKKSVFLPKVTGVDSKKLIELFCQNNRLDVPTTDPELLKFANKIQICDLPSHDIDRNHTDKIEAEWSKISDTFEDYLTQTFPKFRRCHLKLNVYWTRFGTLLSFNCPVTKGVLNEATIFLRDDMGVSQIVEGFLSSILTQQFTQRKMSWLQRESIVDFLGLETNLAHIVTDFSATVLHTNKTEKVSNQLIIDSQKYLKSLSLEKQSKISVKKSMVFIHGEPSVVTFGTIERNFLNSLICQPNEPISYFALGESIWEDDEDAFSLWALSQIAYKVKNKLKKCGINPEVVKNIRGVGYAYLPQN